MLRDLHINDVAFKAPEQLTIKVDQCGYVQLINFMGGDATIVRAARQSTTGELKSYEQDIKLLEYLYKNRHTSPFEMCEIIFEMKLPIFVARQMVRHRTASINEFSARYSEVPDEYFPMPFKEHGATDEIKHITMPAQDPNKHQSSEGEVAFYGEDQYLPLVCEIITNKAFEVYKKLLMSGVSREIARILLPLSTYTKWWFKIDLHNLMHLIRLRDHDHAQKEIRVYAQAMRKLAELVAPETMRIFSKYKLEMVPIE